MYRDGRNIAAYLRELEGGEANSPDVIRYAYDLQAGSYTEDMKDVELATTIGEAASRIAGVLSGLEFDSLLDAGTGEATGLTEILRRLEPMPSSVSALDISLSRLLFARRYLSEAGLHDVSLFTATLEAIPMADASADVVLTVHACESNGGRERELLTELLRVARRYLVLVEPSYERAGPVQRARMDEHRYVKGLPGHLRALGANIAMDEAFGADTVDYNAAAIIVVDKGEPAAPPPASPLVSPISGTPLRRGDGFLYSDDGYAFPVIAGIPCLQAENAILAVHLEEFAGE